ncbi:MAG: hypothetical protein ACF8GE_08180 [Phycisphaerales bacterium JB043]
MMSSRTLVVLLALALAVATTPSTHAGSLTPPPGPVQATNRVQLNAQSITLPYTISSPGSYVLTSDLVGVTGQHGIIIDADNVTLDLNGFTIKGVPGAKSGIYVPTARVNGTILNGTIDGWNTIGDGAVRAENMTGGAYRSLSVTNSGSGLFVGVGSRVESCFASGNIGDGFTLQGSSTIVNCVARQNGHNGFAGGQYCVYENCVAENNTGFSFSDGFGISEGSTLFNCSSIGNSGRGFLSRSSGNQTPIILSNCSTSGNSLEGIFAGPNTIVTSSQSLNNIGVGISLGDGSRINDCTVEGNGSHGILAGANSVISGSIIRNNTSNGIETSNSIVKLCVSLANGGTNVNNAGGMTLETIN